MELIADGLLIAGALAAAFYCWVLSVRVKGLKDLDQGLGAAIAGLSTQVNDMRAALKNTQASAGASVETLRQTTEAAETAANRLANLLENYDDLQGMASRKSTKKPQNPKPASRPAAQPVPNPVPEASPKPAQAVREVTQEVKSVTRAAEPETPPAADISEISAAQKLQEDIRERVTGRSSGGGQEDFVKALQSVLAAANK